MIRLQDLNTGPAPEGEFILFAMKEDKKPDVCSIWTTGRSAFYNHNIEDCVGWYPLDKKQELRTDAAPEIYAKDGAINSILTLTKNPETDWLSKWQVSNTAYYNLHPDECLGWIDLEFPYPLK